MTPHKYIHVKREDFLSYQEKYGHTRLDRWHRIETPDSKLKTFARLQGRVYEEEIFEGRPCEYSIENINSDYLIRFLSENKNEYRFDLMKEPNSYIYHLGFSESKNSSHNDEIYSNLTDRKESVDVFSKLVWILKDMNGKIKVSEYCIGATENEKKNRIYQYMMKFVSGWERRDTNEYDLGWAIYFKI